GSSLPPSKMIGAGFEGVAAGVDADADLPPKMRSRILENRPMQGSRRFGCDSAAGWMKGTSPWRAAALRMQAVWPSACGANKSPGVSRGGSLAASCRCASARVLHRELAVAHDVVAFHDARHVLLGGGTGARRGVGVADGLAEGLEQAVLDFFQLGDIGVIGIAERGADLAIGLAHAAHHGAVVGRVTTRG